MDKKQVERGKIILNQIS